MNPWVYGVIGLAAGWIIELVIDVVFLRKHFSSLALKLPVTPDVADLKARLATAEEELGDAVVKLNSAEATTAETKARLATTESDLVGTVAKLSIAEARPVPEVDNTELNLWKAKFEEAEAKLRNAEQKLAIPPDTAELEAIKSDLADANSKLNFAQVRLEELATVKAQLSESVEKLRAAEELLANPVDTNELNLLREQVAARDSDIAELQSKLLDAEEKVGQLGIAGEALAKSQTKIAELETAHAQTRADLELIKSEIQDHLSQRAKSQELLITLQETLANKERELSEAKAAIPATPVVAVDTFEAHLKAKDEDLLLLQNRISMLMEEKEKLARTPPPIPSGELDALRQELAESKEKLAKLESVPVQLRRELLDKQVQLDSLTAEVELLRTPKAFAMRDLLEKIDGIGPVYQQKLWDAGVQSFADLAATSEERLRAIIQPQEWQNLNFGRWRERAVALKNEGAE